MGIDQSSDQAASATSDLIIQGFVRSLRSTRIANLLFHLGAGQL